MLRIKPDSSDDLLVLLIEADGYKVLYSGPADDVGKIAPVKGVEYRLIQYRDFKWVIRNYILAKAFRGELVPQNPDDEPASDLLERIEGGRR